MINPWIQSQATTLVLFTQPGIRPGRDLRLHVGWWGAGSLSYQNIQFLSLRLELLPFSDLPLRWHWPLSNRWSVGGRKAGFQVKGKGRSHSERKVGGRGDGSAPWGLSSAGRRGQTRLWETRKNSQKGNGSIDVYLLSRWCEMVVWTV